MIELYRRLDEIDVMSHMTWYRIVMASWRLNISLINHGNKDIIHLSAIRQKDEYIHDTPY